MKPAFAVIGLLIVLLAGDGFAQPTSFGTELRTLQNGSVEEKRTVLMRLRAANTAAASDTATIALNDRNAIVRATAASALNALEPHTALKLLQPLLNDKEAFVRREAAFAIGELYLNEAAGALLGRLKIERDADVRASVAAALGKTGAVSAIVPLIEILNTRRSDDTEFLRRSAARSLGQIALAEKGFRRTVVTPQSFLPTEYKTFAAGDLAAGNALFRQASDALAEVLASKKEPADVRREDAFAIGAIGDRRHTQLLKDLSNDSDPFVAEIVREALAAFAISAENVTVQS